MTKVCTKCCTRKPADMFHVMASRCKECAIAASRQWRADNREQHREYARTYQREQPEKYARTQRAWYEANKDRHKANASAWLKKNPYFYRQQSAKNRLKKKRATPVWCNRFFLNEAYRLAALRTKVTGFAWEVDHIVPIRSKIVCGLHCHTNLRVIPKQNNRDKGNKFWPDMPEVAHA